MEEIAIHLAKVPALRAIEKVEQIRGAVELKGRPTAAAARRVPRIRALAELRVRA